MSIEPSVGVYCVGVLNYRSYDDLTSCLESVSNQKLPPRSVLVLDVEPDPAAAAQRRDLEERFPWAEFQDFPNRGYAGGANRLVAWALEQQVRPEFCLLLNPDVILEPEFTQALIEPIRSQRDIAIATGKLLRPDGERLDSAGIDLPHHKRPRDRGSEQMDQGQFDDPVDVFAASGAAMLIRLSAVCDLTLAGELFDEDFFLYHEDTDLCWRARRLGWRVRYEPGAMATHARGWRRERRFEIPTSVRRHSFKNYYLQLIKNVPAAEMVRDFPVVLIWEMLRFAFVLTRDRQMLGAYRQALAASGQAIRKRSLLREKIKSRSTASVGSDLF